jgi:hypothetical protein
MMLGLSLSFIAESMLKTGTSTIGYYTGLLADGYAVTPDKVDSGWNGEAFGKEKVAMIVEGNWMVPFLAGSILMTLPMALIFIVFQRYFVESSSHSAVKG